MFLFLLSLAPAAWAYDEPVNRLQARVQQDEAIQKEVMNALKSEPVLRKEAVSVDVFQGVIRLTGSVSSAMVKTLAGTVVEDSSKTTGKSPSQYS